MKSDVDITRLCEAIARSRLALRQFRENRREMVRQTVGYHYSEEGTKQKVYLNLISLYLSIVSRNLIAKAPRAMLSTMDRALKPTVAAMQLWTNRELERMGLDVTLERVVLDALYSVGICKVALATPADSASVAWSLRAGQPFVMPVDLDDFVYDIHARDFSEVGFMGHRIRVPLDVVKEDSKNYSRSRKDVQPTLDPMYNEQGDERISMIGRSYNAGNLEEAEDYVDLWEIYIPRRRLVLTLPHDYRIGAYAGDVGGSAEPLREQAWLGPERGPYHILGYQKVPGNAMPKGPIQDLIDLHETINGLFRKLIRQADRQKEILGIAAGATEDGKRISEADDGDIIRLDRPEAMKPVMFGSPNPANFALAQALKELFSWAAGNLDIMGGLSPQSKTATQDRMLNENSSRQIADMQVQTIRYTAQVIRAYLWYCWRDPYKVMKAEVGPAALPGVRKVESVYPGRHEDPNVLRRKGDLGDQDIKVDPYSMQVSTPQSRLAALNQVLTQIYLPLAQLAAQQGVAFDFGTYLKKVGEYMDQPDLAEILAYRQPPTEQQSSPGGSEQPTMPAQTERTYTRRSLGGDTSQNRMAGIMNDVNGMQNQNGQQNGMAK